jgi:tetratricopeptide (TPR) repeat protein
MAPLDTLAAEWVARVRLPRRRAVLAVFALIAALALLWARHGTVWARTVAALCALVPLVGVFVARHLEARLWRDPARVIRRVAGNVDPERAARALRAITLVAPDGAAAGEGTSAELARLHVARAVAALPEDRAILAADALGRRLARAALVVAVFAGVLFAVNGWRVVEGLDVLLAWRGVAPVDVVWFEDVEVTARPPDYLHEEERRIRAYDAAALPWGTLLTVRGTLVHLGRQVALTDGTSEVPFVDDGAGGVVARWPLAESVSLGVSARFGEVVIREPERTHITSIADEPPKVTLEGAPRRVTIATDEDDGTIPVRYEAEDDHGLREVHLVLRSGVREERRVLAHLDGEIRQDRGGYLLRRTDPFLKKSHAPVEVTVEAKDNDPVTGPKWGASAAIVVILPDIAEPEARRLDAFRKLRDAWVDTLAFGLGHDLPGVVADRRAFLTEESRRETESEDLLDATTSARYEGIRVALRLSAMLHGQARKVREAMTKEARGPSAATHRVLIAATERMVLVVDAIVQGLGQKDTRAACKKLADVADDLAEGASQMQKPTDRDRGLLRADASTHVLEGGARSLARLGVLGRDLGEIITSDLSRVGRARGADDLLHAEIAARDLATRLRQQDPSFGGSGRASGRAGGESGGGRGTPGEDEGEPDDVEQAFNMAAQEVDRLAADHASELGKVEQALNAATDEADVKDLAEEAKKHAQAVRNAVRSLPPTSASSDSWTSKGSAARENAEAMARAFEQGDPADAVGSGRSAIEAIDEAKRVADRERWTGLFPPSGDNHGLADQSLNEARQKLEPEVKWAEEQLARLRKRAAERKSGELSDDGDEERKLAERAAELGRMGRDRQAMPEGALDSLEEAERVAREAADALKRGEVDKGLERQREAQHQLEMAKEALGGESPDGEGAEGDLTSHVDIPTENGKGKSADQFRRRVLKGLSQAAAGRQKDAVRRYAEGLLR